MARAKWLARPAAACTLSIVVLLAAGVVCARRGGGPQGWNLDIEKAMDTAGVAPGMTVGEAGAGDGYFTFALAERVGANGRVYANDIDTSALGRLDARSRREHRANIVTVAGEAEDPVFPSRALDMIVIVHAFHDFGNPVAWLRNARKYLRSGGTVAIIDRDPVRSGENHFLARERIGQLFAQAGYEVVTSGNVERNHLVMTFRVKN